MAVTDVKKIDMRGGRTRRSTRNVVKTVVWTYQVLCDSRNDTEQTVLADGRLPQIYAPHDDDGALQVIDVSAELDTVTTNASVNGLKWRVDVTFSDDLPCDIDNPFTPLDDPLEITWSVNRFQVPVEKDIDDKAIVNFAGDPFDPSPEKDDGNRVLTIVRNEEFKDYKCLFDDDLLFRLNKNEFYGRPARTMKLVDINRIADHFNCIPFWRTTYVFEFNRFGWDLELLQQGYRVKTTGPTPTVDTARDEFGAGFNQPVLLSQDGTQHPPNAEPLFSKFKVYGEVDFKLFDLEPNA